MHGSQGYDKSRKIIETLKAKRVFQHWKILIIEMEESYVGNLGGANPDLFKTLPSPFPTLVPTLQPAVANVMTYLIKFKVSISFLKLF